MMRAVGWLALLGWLIWLPGARELTRSIYCWGAQRRYRFGACPIQKPAEAPHRAHTAFLEMP